MGEGGIEDEKKKKTNGKALERVQKKKETGLAFVRRGEVSKSKTGGRSGAI